MYVVCAVGTAWMAMPHLRIGSREESSWGASRVTTATCLPTRAAAIAPHSTALPNATRGVPW